MDIKIYLAEPRGYCAGVHRAIDILNQSIKKFPAPIYVNHEIIHNKFIINYFEKKWVIFWEKLENIPENSLMIMSAHWVGPKFIKKVKEKKIRYIDASCPLVTKVHIEAKKFLKDWYDIIYIWKKWHQEAESMREEWKEKIHIIWKLEELDKIKINNSKIALLTQTTLSVSETKVLIEEVKERFPEIVLPKKEDICYATTNRQEAVNIICEKDIDLLIIVGSKNSSNSNKLKEIWEKLNINSILIDSSNEIDINLLRKMEEKKWNIKIWISSWASAPEILVKEVVDFLNNLWNIDIEKIKTIEEKMVFPTNLEIK